MTFAQLSRSVLNMPMADAVAMIERETTIGDPVEIYWDIIERHEMAVEMADCD